AADSWYSKAVEWAEANGIVKGIGGGKFAPEAVITREQIATILYRYEEFKNGAPAVEGDLKAFPDAANVSDFATTAMVWAIENEIITGASVNNVTYLKPLDSATREQIATIIMRYLEGE
ncbi:MAG: S-layer homology domain-containing protein, partial [Ruminococcaceae bacterium]|nr:S-layer homology domain-containing protein [Oscillospiraceae bacterium]